MSVIARSSADAFPCSPEVAHCFPVGSMLLVPACAPIDALVPLSCERPSRVP